MSKPVSETTVNIRGTNYQLRTDLGDETVNQLAEMVDSRMKELDPAGSLPPAKVSVLTSLRIASELHDVQQRADGDRTLIARRLERLHDLLDEALGGE